MAFAGGLLAVIPFFAVGSPRLHWWPLESSLVFGLALLIAGFLRALLSIRTRGTVRAIEAPPEPAPSTGFPSPGAQAPQGLADLGRALIGGALLLFLGHSAATALPMKLKAQSTTLMAPGLVLTLLAFAGFRSKRLADAVRSIVGKAAGWMRVGRLQLMELALAPVLAWGAWLSAGDGARMRLPYLPVGLWIAGVALIIHSAWPRGGVTWVAPSRIDVMAVAGLVLVALLARAIRAETIPWQLSGDEGSGGLSAVDFVEGRLDNPFTVAWFSFPSLYFFVQSLSIRLFGQTISALRWTSALAGALTVGLLYGFARVAFGRWVALAAAAYLAAFHFHIHFSRLGLSNIWDGLFASAFALALWWGWSRESRLGVCLAGIALGLSQYFYPGIRVLFLLLPVWLLIMAWRDRAGFRRRLPHLVALLVALVVVALPLAVHYLAHPTDFTAPMMRVSLWGRLREGQPWYQIEGVWAYLISKLLTSALAFTAANLQFYYQSNTPMLLPLPATLFLVGLVVMLFEPRKPIHLWIALWLAGAVVIGAVSDSTPAAQRYVVAAPAVALVVALGLVGGASLLAKAMPSAATPISVGAVAVLLFAGWGDLTFYFGDFSASHTVGDANTEVATALGKYLATREPGTQVYFLGGRMGYFTHATIRYLAPEAIGRDVNDALTGPPDWEISGPTIFVVLPERRAELQHIMNRYPGGTTIRKSGRNGLLYLAYMVAES
jgi:4-amino-4-deoxy-L-arabinose transferase-like glycosyltransferase